MIAGLASRAPQDSAEQWRYWEQLGSFAVNLAAEVVTEEGVGLSQEILDTIFATPYGWSER